MPLKRLTPELKSLLANRQPLEIPSDLIIKARRLTIMAIYFIQDLDLADYGVYGNHIVIVNDGKYIDFDICPKNAVKTIIDLLI